MNQRSPLVAGTFAILTVLVASPPPAEANFKRQHASSCIEDGLPPIAAFQDQFLVNTSVAFFDVVVCGMPEETSLRKDRVVRLSLTGIDGSTVNSVFARACVGFSGGTGVACDPFVNNGAAANMGPFTIAIPHPNWNASHRLDFAYVQTFAPPLQNGFSGISGVFYADVNG
jgi:hypothetical protein